MGIRLLAIFELTEEGPNFISFLVFFGLLFAGTWWLASDWESYQGINRYVARHYYYVLIFPIKVSYYVVSDHLLGFMADYADHSNNVLILIFVYGFCAIVSVLLIPLSIFLIFYGVERSIFTIFQIPHTEQAERASNAIFANVVAAVLILPLVIWIGYWAWFGLKWAFSPG